MPRKENMSNDSNKCKFKSFFEMTQVSFDEIKMGDMIIFVQDRIYEINNYPWLREKAKNELFEIFKRDSIYWKKVIDGNFLISFVRPIGKKRWKTLRDQILLVIDYDRYIEIENINGLYEWNLPPINN